MKSKCKIFLAVDIEKINDLPSDVDIVFFEDHIGNESTSQDSWSKLNHLIGQRDSTLFFIEYFYSEDLINNTRTLCVPFQACHTSLAIDKILPAEPWIQKTTAFNFSINKMRENRLWLLQKLQDCQLSTSAYTVYQSPVENFKNKFWIGPGGDQHPGHVNNNSFTNIEIYYHFLKNNVYEPSFVSLITEPGFNDRSTTMTEKTLFAFEAGTMPLWIGGFQQARQCQRLGFDVFDDVIDHSYQFVYDPILRMQKAIDSNINLLKDINQLERFFITNQERFLHNRQHLRTCNWFYRLLDRELQRVPLTVAQLNTVYRQLIIEHNAQWPRIRFPDPAPY